MPEGTIWWNRKVIKRALADEHLDRVVEVLDALECLERNPRNPVGVPVFRARTQPSGSEEDDLVAELPYGWFMSFEVLERVPPVMATVIKVKAFVRVPDL